ncbi:unnamed protein product [Paramecium octaurelia]|uniref:Uncharacterized protein n=1 Tax=Paramecium octaurelia TaxID=43137 RepID=A0A8S1YI03_PAROT|nr:unnamed protein product [Paramecium octaurelia]
MKEQAKKMNRTCQTLSNFKQIIQKSILSLKEEHSFISKICYVLSQYEIKLIDRYHLKWQSSANSQFDQCKSNEDEYRELIKQIKLAGIQIQFYQL